MSTWKSYRVAVTFVTAGLVVLLVLLVSRIRLGGAPSERWESLVIAGEQTRDSHDRLVFMLTTGFEDLREVELCLDDVKAAKASGYAADVILIVRGRGIEALTNLSGRPSQLAELAREVKASGVHIVASDNELKQGGISAARMDPTPSDLVPDAAVRMTELVSQGYQVIRY
jgi:intracellular sulfur oxidation DsrE/DsrF family protein